MNYQGQFQPGMPPQIQPGVPVQAPQPQQFGGYNVSPAEGYPRAAQATTQYQYPQYQTTGYPPQMTGYPQPQYQQTVGYPTQTTGYPQQQFQQTPGYPTQTTGYPQQQFQQTTGYPQYQATGFPQATIAQMPMGMAPFATTTPPQISPERSRSTSPRPSVEVEEVFVKDQQDLRKETILDAVSKLGDALSTKLSLVDRLNDLTKHIKDQTQALENRTDPQQKQMLESALKSTTMEFETKKDNFNDAETQEQLSLETISELRGKLTNDMQDLNAKLEKYNKDFEYLNETLTKIVAFKSSYDAENVEAARKGFGPLYNQIGDSITEVENQIKKAQANFKLMDEKEEKRNELLRKTNELRSEIATMTGRADAAMEAENYDLTDELEPKIEALKGQLKDLIDSLQDL